MAGLQVQRQPELQSEFKRNLCKLEKITLKQNKVQSNKIIQTNWNRTKQTEEKEQEINTNTDTHRLVHKEIP